MANLRVDKITSTETFERTGSVQFDGSTTNIRAGWVDDYNYLHNGTEDWTVECWIYRNGTNNRQVIWSTGGISSVVGMVVRIESGAVGGNNGDAIGVQLSKSTDGTWLFWGSGDTKVDKDKWYHIAVVFRSSNKSLEIYVDGKLTNGNIIKCEIKGDRDPGYGSTSKMISECAVCLTKDNISNKGGIWTPASLMAGPLIKRLRDNAGLTFKINNSSS